MFILIHHPLLSDVWPGPFETFGATYGPTAVWPKALLSGVRDLVLRPAFFLLGAFGMEGWDLSDMENLSFFSATFYKEYCMWSFPAKGLVENHHFE